MDKIGLGNYGENKAVQFLVEKGYQIVDRNVRTPYGEIDIISLDPEQGESEYVFVEVKTRRQNPLWNPSEAISNAKQKHMIDSASHYINEHCQTRSDWRIDVIMVEIDQKEHVRLTHFENALFE